MISDARPELVNALSEIGARLERAHEEYGGVYPAPGRDERAKNCIATREELNRCASTLDLHDAHELLEASRRLYDDLGASIRDVMAVHKKGAFAIHLAHKIDANLLSRSFKSFLASGRDDLAELNLSSRSVMASLRGILDELGRLLSVAPDRVIGKIRERVIKERKSFGLVLRDAQDLLDADEVVEQLWQPLVDSIDRGDRDTPRPVLGTARQPWLLLCFLTDRPADVSKHEIAGAMPSASVRRAAPIEARQLRDEAFDPQLLHRIDVPRAFSGPEIARCVGRIGGIWPVRMRADCENVSERMSLGDWLEELFHSSGLSWEGIANG